jgi:hypothetical protein
MLRSTWFAALMVIVVALIGLAFALTTRVAAQSTRPPAASPAEGTATAVPTPACGFPPNWQLGPALFPARTLFQGAVADDGAFYIAGGQDPTGQTVFGNLDRFDPTTNMWAPRAPLPVPVGQAAVGATAGKVLVVGGCLVCAGAGYNITTTLQIYDLASGEWSFGAPLPTRLEDAAAAGLDGKYYIMGGDDHLTPQRTTYVYDIAADTWSFEALLPDVTGRTNTSATTAGGRIYVFGGDSDINRSAALNTLLSYDPTANVWSTLATLAIGRIGSWPRVSAFGTGQLLITAGATASGAVLPSTFSYDIEAHQFYVDWYQIVPHAGHGQGALPDGRVIVYGGLSSNNAATGSTEFLPSYVPCATPTPGEPTATVPAPSATVVLPTVTPCAVSFSDVHPADYFYTPVQRLACGGIISGYADGTFRPYNNTTRGQMVKIIMRAYGPPPGTPATGFTFADVPPSHPFYSFIEAAATANIVSGYACGAPGEACDAQNRPYFRPNASVTRGQLSKIIVAAVGWTPQNPATPTFADVAPGSAFYTAVETALRAGVISGYNCGGPGEPCGEPPRLYFRPYANATRGQIAKIVYGIAPTAGR